MWLIRDYILVKTKSTFFRSRRGTLDFLQTKRDSILCTHIYTIVSLRILPSYLATITYDGKNRATLTGPWTLARNLRAIILSRRLFPPTSSSRGRTPRQSHPPSVHYRRAVLSRALCSSRSLDWGCVASRRAVHTSRGGENGSIAGVASRLPENENDNTTMGRNARRFPASIRFRVFVLVVVVLSSLTGERTNVRSTIAHHVDLWSAAASSGKPYHRGGWMSRRRQRRRRRRRRRPDVGRRVRVLSLERRRRTRGENDGGSSVCTRRRDATQPACIALSCACHLSSKLKIDFSWDKLIRRVIRQSRVVSAEWSRGWRRKCGIGIIESLNRRGVSLG